MQYDFDCIIDRTQIDSVKWTAYPKMFFRFGWQTLTSSHLSLLSPL